MIDFGSECGITRRVRSIPCTIYPFFMIRKHKCFSVLRYKPRAHKYVENFHIYLSHFFSYILFSIKSTSRFTDRKLFCFRWNFWSEIPNENWQWYFNISISITQKKPWNFNSNTSCSPQQINFDCRCFFEEWLRPFLFSQEFPVVKYVSQ